VYVIPEAGAPGLSTGVIIFTKSERSPGICIQTDRYPRSLCRRRMRGRSSQFRIKDSTRVGLRGPPAESGGSTIVLPTMRNARLAAAKRLLHFLPVIRD